MPAYSRSRFSPQGAIKAMLKLVYRPFAINVLQGYRVSCWSWAFLAMLIDSLGTHRLADESRLNYIEWAGET